MPGGNDFGKIERDMRERLEASPFHAGLGITLARGRAGEVDLRLEARDDHVNLLGSVHGGVLATLADTAAGGAGRWARPQGSPPRIVHLSVQYLAPASPGTLLATGRVVRLGRRLAFAEADVDDADGVALARAQVTVAVSPPPPAQ